MQSTPGTDNRQHAREPLSVICVRNRASRRRLSEVSETILGAPGSSVHAVVNPRSPQEAADLAKQPGGAGFGPCGGIEHSGW